MSRGFSFVRAELLNVRKYHANQGDDDAILDYRGMNSKTSYFSAAKLRWSSTRFISPRASRETELMFKVTTTKSFFGAAIEFNNREMVTEISAYSAASACLRVGSSSRSQTSASASASGSISASS